MAEQPINRPTTTTLPQKPTEPGSATLWPALNLLVAVGVAAVLLAVSGLTLAGTVLFLVAVTPVLAVLSPVLVPAVAVALLAVVGFVLSCGFGFVAVSVLAWAYNYVRGKQPPGSKRLESARYVLAKKAREVKEKARERSAASKNAQDANAGA